ncbi:PTS fructose transporter subunit IIABC [Changpingibacter yushuensis]|uniref:PTS fructose transporter subunit IIABC n=1 Tax=Changpingibacter yushuensis TaxID=2758440 RepID=UPI00165D71F9|nr:fructose-specific PTS transporter subunit EIIC [Changpingibacter yushuensis]
MSNTLMTPELVRLGVQPAGDKLAVIGQMAELIASTGRAEQAGLEAAMLDRESKFATGMPGGIAIPHCRSAAVSEAALGFMRLSEPVDFGAKDGPADIVIAIAAPDADEAEHMKLLAKLSRALVRKEFLASLRTAGSEQEVSDLIMGAINAQPKRRTEAATAGVAPAGPSTAEPAPTQANMPVSEGVVAGPVIVAITSCPTGIAHTYMAAESLENAARDKGIEIHVETQGSGGVEWLSPETIARADALIIASDVNVTGRERFAGMPLIESPVKRAISNGPQMIDEAIAASSNPRAARVEAGKGANVSEVSGGTPRWGSRIQQALMTGVSYMIPFVAAGGLLTALGFLVGGYDVAFVSNDVVLNYSFWNLPDVATVASNAGLDQLQASSGFMLYTGAVLQFLGSTGMGFLVAALSGYIAFGLAGRPGIAPGFIGGAVAVVVGAGFIGGLITGILAGLVAYWFTTLKAPRWLSGLMPVVIIPLITTFIVGGLMLTLLGRPLASFMTWLQESLTSMSGGGAGILLGIILGLMMCFDMGGPVNKAAYLFATAGLAAQTQASWEIMAAVMASGMVPPLAMALSTVLRPKLYTEVERENGTAAWLLGASFISEGAIPFAAADPFRVIPSAMVGGGVTGAIIMALGVGSKAPHGGIFVFFAIDPAWAYVLAVVVGSVVAGLLVTALKSATARKSNLATEKVAQEVAA